MNKNLNIIHLKNMSTIKTTNRFCCVRFAGAVYDFEQNRYEIRINLRTLPNSNIFALFFNLLNRFSVRLME